MFIRSLATDGTPGGRDLGLSNSTVGWLGSKVA
jgi:hypothetical protein